MGLKINRNEGIHHQSSVIFSSAWPSKLYQLLFCHWKPGFLALCLWLYINFITSISIARSFSDFNYLLLRIIFIQKQPIAHVLQNKVFLKTKNAYAGESFSVNCRLEEYNFIKRGSITGVFLWIIWNFFKNTFFEKKMINKGDYFCISI